MWLNFVRLLTYWEIVAMKYVVSSVKNLPNDYGCDWSNSMHYDLKLSKNAEIKSNNSLNIILNWFCNGRWTFFCSGCKMNMQFSWNLTKCEKTADFGTKYFLLHTHTQKRCLWTQSAAKAVHWTPHFGTFYRQFYCIWLRCLI